MEYLAENQKSISPSKRQGNHIAELDGLRGVAILMVIVFHLFQMVPSVRSAFPHLFTVLSRVGQSGVDLFFVLSGFLITGVLLQSKNTPNYFRNFFMRRTLRIFPLYYATLISLSTLGFWWNFYPDALPDFWMWIYLSNFPVTFGWGEIAWPHFWSLAVEEQFYLFWPFVVYCLSRRSLLLMCIFLFIGAIFFRWALVNAGYSSFWLLPCRMDALATGGLIAIIRNRNPNLNGLNKTAWLLLGISGLIAGLMFVWGTGKGLNSIQIFKFTMTSLLFGSALILCVSEVGPAFYKRILKLRSLSTAGKYSYALYVFHPMIIELVLASQQWNSAKAFRNLITPAIYDLFFILIISAILSWLSWQLLESRFLALKKHFKNKPECEIVDKGYVQS